MLTVQNLGLSKAAYSVNETLNILSVSRTSLYEMVKKGSIRPTKYGKKTLFLSADIAAFLNNIRNAEVSQ